MSSEYEKLWDKIDKLYQEAVLLYLHQEISAQETIHELAVSNALDTLATRITGDAECFAGAIDVLKENGRSRWASSDQEVREIVIHFLLKKSNDYADCAHESMDFGLNKGAACRISIVEAFTAAAKELGHVTPG